MYGVSVIIPTYNREGYIKKAIDSVLCQKGQNTNFSIEEVIVIDDCSDDGTEDMIKQMYGGEVLYHRLSENFGAAFARNEGVKLAKGEWIAFQDSDDKWHSDKLLKQFEYLKQHPDMSMVCHQIKAFFDNGEEDITPVVEDNDFVVALAEKNYFGTPTMLVKREAFNKCGGFDVRLRALEDWDFAIRFADKYCIGMVPEPLIDVDMVLEGISADPSKYYDCRCKMIAWNRSILLKHDCFDSAIRSLFINAEKNGVLEMVGRLMEIYLTD